MSDNKSSMSNENTSDTKTVSQRNEKADFFVTPTTNFDVIEIENRRENQVGSPVADLEPTTKAVPRKSDEPIDRGKQQNPQTSSHDVE